MMRSIISFKFALALAALCFSSTSEAQNWTSPTTLAPTGSSSSEPFSYYSLAANPGTAIVLNTGATDVNGFSNGPELGWNSFFTNGWVENDGLLPTSQAYNKVAFLPQILTHTGFGIGVMQGSAGGIYGFIFSNGSWSKGQAISSDPTAEFPFIALNGNVYNIPVYTPWGIALWNSSTPNQPIYYSLYTQAFALPAPIWTTPATIPNSNGYYPSITCDVMGNSVAVWINPATSTVDSATYILDNSPDYGVWSAITSIGSSDGESFPRVKMVPATGFAVALWIDANSNVNTSSMPLGGSWSAPTILSTTSGNSAPSLTIDPVGNATAVWQDGSNNIYGAFLPENGSWSSAVLLGTGSNPEVSIDTIGNSIAVWSDTNQNIQYALLPFNGSWTSATQLSGSGLGSILPKVGSTGDSAVAVIWEETSSGNLIGITGTDVFPPEAPRGITVTSKNKGCDRKVAFLPTWDSSIVNYLVYRNSTLIATIPFSGPYIYKDKGRCQNSGDVYSVVSVNSSGVKSSPVTANVPVSKKEKSRP